MRSGTHLVFRTSQTPSMTRRFKQGLALWFALQIVLPFTAPLQACDLADLLGARSHHASPVSPESSTTPTIAETRADAPWFVSPIESSALRMFSDLAPPDLHVAAHVVGVQALSPVPHVQPAVLRL